MAVLIALFLLSCALAFSQSSKIAYSRFFGGRIDADAHAVCVDIAGNAYIVGNTFAARSGEPVHDDFPVSPSSFFKERSLGRQGFLIKLDPTGKTIFSTLLPTNNVEGIALDRLGNIYLTGEYLGRSNATPGAFQEQSHGGGDGHYSGEAYVMKLDATGTRLLWATNLGGSRYERAGGIAVDSQNRVYVTGWTTSLDFPLTQNAWQKTFTSKTWEDGAAFVTVFDPDGTRLVFSSFMGNSTNASGHAIKVDLQDQVFVTGNARAGFPTTKGAWREKGSGAFVAKVDIERGRLSYATYLGDGQIQAHAEAVDEDGNVYVTGYTDGASFPTTQGAYQSAANGKDVTAFVIKLNPAGTSAVFSTLLGGGTTEWGMAIGLDRNHQIYVTGRTSSGDFPTTDGAPQRQSPSDQEDVFCAVLTPDGEHLKFSTLIGGLGREFPYAMAVTNTGEAVVVGHTNSDWLVRPTNKTRRGELGTAFVLKLVP